MDMVCTNDGKKYFLDLAMDSGAQAPANWHVRLFKNNYTPVDGSVSADFTESTFTGYAAVAVATNAMGAATIVGDVAESTKSAAPTYACSGGSSETAYGWYLTEDAGSKTLLAQRFDTPRLMSPGATESLDPFTIKLKTFA